MFIIKKKEYLNWLFFLKNLNINKSNTLFVLFLNSNFNNKITWKEFSLFCMNNNIHKIPNFYLSTFNKFIFKSLKGNPIYSLVINDFTKLNILNKNFNFLFFINFNLTNNIFIYYPTFFLNYLNNFQYKFLLLLKKPINSFILILNLILIFITKIFFFKLKNDIFN